MYPEAANGQSTSPFVFNVRYLSHEGELRTPNGGPVAGNGASDTAALWRWTFCAQLRRTPLLTCKQAVYEEDDDCANYGTDQSRALARAVPS